MNDIGLPDFLVSNECWKKCLKNSNKRD